MHKKFYEKLHIQIIIGIVAFIIVPFFINLLFKFDLGLFLLQAEWDARDVLSFYDSILSFAGTVFLGMMALRFNKYPLNIVIKSDYFAWFSSEPCILGGTTQDKKIANEYNLSNFDVTFEAYNPTDFNKVLKEPRIEFCCNGKTVCEYISKCKTTKHGDKILSEYDVCAAHNINSKTIIELTILMAGIVEKYKNETKKLGNSNSVWFSYMDENGRKHKTLIKKYENIEELNSFITSE